MKNYDGVKFVMLIKRHQVHVHYDDYYEDLLQFEGQINQY